jgi:hypothetical protein
VDVTDMTQVTPWSCSRSMCFPIEEGWQEDKKSSTTVDDQLTLINPMDFVGTKADTAPN